MVNTFLEIIKVARPVHWIKNFALFAAILFSGNLFSKFHFVKTVEGFIIFSIATSAAYIFNDILDAKSDKIHPIKKYRPIASGRLPASKALPVSIIFAFISIYLSTQINALFTISILAYLILQISYSLFLKHIPIIDILIIAAGFIIRVYAGAFAVDAHLSVWFLLCIISMALFLASGKRRAEINIVEHTRGRTRKSLTKYKRELLNSYVTMFGNAAWLSWALFSFFESPRASLSVWLFLAELSRTTAIDKLLMATIPVVIFGIMRYESLIFEGRTEAPEKLFLTDKSLIISVFIWMVMVIWTIYYGGITSFV